MSLKIERNDSPYFIGAYNADLSQPTIMLNVEAIIHAYKDEKSWKEMADGVKDTMLSTLTHEFCHIMQQFLDKEFDELEVEKTLGLYNENWNVFNAEKDEQDEPSFNLRQLIEFIRGDESETAQELKDKIEYLFRPHILWIDAEDKYNAENNGTESLTL